MFNPQNLKQTKKAQATMMDLLLGAFIFFIIFITLILLFNFYSNKLNDRISQQELEDKAFMLTELLLSQGKPAGWNKDNFEIIGLATYDKHITSSRFSELQKIPYDTAKHSFGLEGYDFYIRITNDEIVEEYGSDIDLAGKNVISLHRLIFYDNSASQIELRVWKS